MQASSTSFGAVATGRSSIGERYRALHNRRALTWWSTVFGYPIARFLLIWIVPVRWITPTRLTLVGFVVKLAAAGALLGAASPASLIAAIALLQVSQVLDSMDGTLARARGQASATGAYLDKLTDAVGLFAICAVVGVRAAAGGDGAVYPVLACAGAFACDLACYMYWVTRAVVPAAARAGRIDGGAPALDWRAIRREWLCGWLKLPLFLEADLYLWIGVFAWFGAWRPLCIVLAATQTAALVVVVTDHLIRLSRRPS